MMLLGIDYGAKNIGLAIGASGSIALPFLTIRNQGLEKVWGEIKKIIEEEEIDLIVVGLPLLAGGKGSQMTEKVLEFGNFLSKNLPVPVKFQNEMLTSKEVEKLFVDFKKEKKKISKDAAEAMVMLQSYIDKNK